MTHIIIVGLGPGDPGLLTRAAWDALSAAGAVYLRTDQHPTVAALPAGLVVHSFDALYASSDDFQQVYQRIARQVVALAQDQAPQPLVYGVPGDPAVGEATTWLIRDLARDQGVPVTVISGVSFLEPACLALGLDPLERDGLQLVDAMVVALNHAPPLDPSRPALLAQCYSRSLAGDVKLTLMHSFPPDHELTILRGLGGAGQEMRSVALHELDRSIQFDHLTTLFVPALGPFGSFQRLQETVAHLRAPGGCPWDREQTLQSLRSDLMEEAHELLEALDADDDQTLVEELGDLTLLVAMLAQIASEEERLQWPQVMAQINQKLVRRHPHVFGDLSVSGTDEVLDNWARIKQEEKRVANGGQTASPLASVPRSLPALALAQKYQDRLQRAQLVVEAGEAGSLGWQLWDWVVQARARNEDAESALREVCRQVAGQVEALLDA